MFPIIKEFRIDAELLSSLHEASEDDLQALAELHEDPTNDDQIELYIYLCFLIFGKLRNMQSLEKAIHRAGRWATMTPASHPDHDRRFSILDTLVIWDYQFQTGEEDIRAQMGRSKPHYQEASQLLDSFAQTGRLECLTQGIEKMKLAIRIAGHYTTPYMLNLFGILLGLQFTHTGSTDDLNQAISVLSEAVDATPHNDPNRAPFLCNLGQQFWNRYQQKGLIEDLNQAISLDSEAVDATSNNIERATCLNNLGGHLVGRYQWMGSIDDLNRAVDVHREAVDILPHDHPDRVPFLANLGAAIGKRFRRTGSMDDLNQAISITSEAADATPHGHPERYLSLGNLGVLFGVRSEHTGSIDDLDQAISNYNKAVDGLPGSHPSRAPILGNLGSSYMEACFRTGSIDHCNDGIRVSDEAISLTPPNDPNRVSYSYFLARCLIWRYTQPGSTDGSEVLDRALSLLTTVWYCEMAPPSRRIQAANFASKLLMYKKDWEQSYQLLRDATSLLHKVSLRFSNRADIQDLLSYSSGGLASNAVSAALNAGRAPEDALGLLEQGRGIIAGLLMDMRGDITDVRRQYPDLAENFILLRDELDLPSHRTVSLASTDKVSSWELQISRYREANREFSQIIDTIRAQPGFSRFLQPPDVQELMGAAEQGPIIVLNTNLFRCDALLIQPDSIEVIELPSLKEEEVFRTVTGLLENSDLSPLLEWLWHTICHPCLNALGINDAVSDDNWPHIWWIPTGVLSQLPLHAAGIYKQGSKETVLDRAVSSYASSIKALLHGRRHEIQEPRPSPSMDFALIVSMQETPELGGRGSLPFAADEAHMLRDLCPQLQLASVTPSQNKEDVLKHLPKCKIFHFAGHGQSDPRDPSRSCLLLKDWKTNPLTVGDIRDSRLQDDPPFLAYLSACSTGANKAMYLADEGIHLMSAFQLAGFRHAIGTLWEVSDQHCVGVAKILYKTLQEEGMTDLAVSRGLHRAVRALRDGNVEDVLTRDAKLVRPRPASQGVTDFLWVPYVHFGV